MTLDGKTATLRGDSRWISSDASREFVHRERDASDAIVVGAQTVQMDDPSLTVRLPARLDVRAPRQNPPWRVILDTHARTPPAAKLVANNRDHRTLFLVGETALEERVAALRSAGSEVVRQPNADKRVDPAAALDEIAQRGGIRVLLEGGGELTAAFFERKLVDRVLAFVAPKLVGGQAAPTPLGGLGLHPMSRAVALSHVETRAFGDDFLVEGLLDWGE
jgi:diaminohydroxyphosphoribosylaminopyrimidine deaminase/5-amino-6-(5-phosphoribosylamino)uracil reductase